MPQFHLPPMARKLKDSKRYQNRFEIDSDRGDKVYTIAFDTSTGHHTCSCLSCRFRGSGRDCKHLRRLCGYLNAPCAQAPLTRRKASRKTPKPPSEVVKTAMPWSQVDVAEAALEFIV